MKRNSEIIRVGLVGYGYAGRTFHAPLIQSVPGLALTVVGSSKLSLVQAELGEVKVCHPSEVATDPDVDLVVIATPNDSHFPIASTALRAGKDVVVDKPFTVTLAEARTLLEISEEHNRLLSVFHNRRWESEVQATREILHSGKLGVVSHYECHLDRFRPVVRSRWRENPGPGSGLWFDLGPHLIDQALYLFGMPNSVNANFGILREKGQTDDWAHVQLNYDRLRVILHASLLVSGGGPRSMLHGTLASWAKYGADMQERQLVARMQPGTEGFGYDPDPGILYDGATGERIEIHAPAGNQRQYYVDMRNAVLNNGPVPVPAHDAVACMAILETSFESGARGRVLDIPLTPSERTLWKV